MLRFIFSKHRHWYTNNITSLKTFELKFDIPPTVKIFQNNTLNPNLFRITTAISGLQLLLWGYLSYFALTELTNKSSNSPEEPSEENIKQEVKDEEVKEEDSSKSSIYKWFMSSKWRISLSLLSLSAGTVFVLMAYIYPLRVTRSLTFIRPIQALRVETYSPLGTSRSFEVPLTDVVCNTTYEQQAQGQNIALKIKGYNLFFLVNPRNTYVHPMLKSLVLNRQNVK